MRSLVAAGLWAALSVATQTADAQERIARLSLDEAVTLALLENPVVRAKEFERQAVAANEITAGLRPRQARDTVDYAYRRGGVSLLDFLDAQRTYRETSLEYLRTLGSYRAAVYQLEAAVGGPLEN